MTLLLGIDLGTSSVRAGLLDTEQRSLLAVAGREYPLNKPAPTHAEQDPADWWAATVAAVQQVMADVPPDTVAGISFSGQMHGTVLLDRAGEPLHPAIIWADQRGADFCDALSDTLGTDRYLAQTGTLPAAGFMGTTLLWLARHRPDLLEDTHRVILPKDYVRLRMTGTIATEVSDAASTGLFDITARRWASAILDRAGLPASLFPEVLASSTQAGTLTAKAAGELGLPTGLPVIAGCADQPAQAIGNGVITPLPMAWAGWSAHPAMTGRPVGKPSSPAAFAVRVPAWVEDASTSGNSDAGSPARSRIALAHRRAVMSNRPVLAASLTSVAMVPVMRSRT